MTEHAKTARVLTVLALLQIKLARNAAAIAKLWLDSDGVVSSRDRQIADLEHERRHIQALIARYEVQR